MSIRSGVESVFDGLHSASRFLSASSAPLDTYGGRHFPSLLDRSFDEIKNAVEHGPAFTLADLPAYINAVATLGDNIDDKKLLLERVVTLMSRLGSDNEFATRLQHFVINILYKDLPHPPSTYLTFPPVGPLVANSNVANATQPSHAAWTRPTDYVYRSTDGSYYNPLLPTLGMARSPYARTVPAQHPLPRAALPPADLVFDTLLKRDKFVQHPGGISSLFFAFADIIIHNIFNTDYKSNSINKSSSYLDLSPLYGTSQAEVNGVRKHDGTGRLKDDVFADRRLTNMPPAVGALLIIFNRNHNYVAERILAINENGNFKNPPFSDSKDQDEEIFQRARLVNTGYFVQIILRDYVGAILRLAHDGSPWRLDPLANSRDINHDVSPRGQGNVVSVEFNLVYRWHASISEADTLWIEQHFAEKLPGLDPRTITVEDLARMSPTGPVEEWTFGSLSRDEHGRFRDADLAKILQNATAASASAFKARGTPEILRVVELLGIEQGRIWGTCTLNEFRKFLGLKPYANFLEWNGTKEIADAAASLYRDIDNLELYVGLQAEEAKQFGPGAGLCPGYTISRAILADAVALTRGDRFLTVDFTPQNLTTWGFDDCQPNTSDGSYGGMLTKLLFRHLPDHYPVRSTYAHFPFLVPEKMKQYVRDHSGNVESKYTWNRPPVQVGPTIPATRYSDVQQLLSNSEIFNSGVAKRLDILTGGVHLNIAPVEKILTNNAALERAADSFTAITKYLINEKKSKSVSPYLDVVRDVINLVPVHWLSTYIIGLPLKTTQNPQGIFTEEDLYALLATVANYVYINTDRSHDWFLRERSQNAFHKIEPFLKGHFARLTRGSVNIEGITDAVLRWVAMKGDHYDDFLEELARATGSPSGNGALDSLVGSLFASVVPTAALFSKIIAHVVDFYLEKDKEREQIIHLAETHANDEVIPFIFEALRLNPPLSSILLSARSPERVGNTAVAQGQQVLASIVKATHEAPPCVNSDTTARVEAVLGLDRRGLLNPKLFEQVAPALLKEIFKLKPLVRYPTRYGTLQLHTETIRSVPEQFYTDLSGQVTPFPVSLFVQFAL